jgi:hypothetical protein
MPRLGAQADELEHGLLQLEDPIDQLGNRRFIRIADTHVSQNGPYLNRKEAALAEVQVLELSQQLVEASELRSGGFDIAPWICTHYW